MEGVSVQTVNLLVVVDALAEALDQVGVSFLNLVSLSLDFHDRNLDFLNLDFHDHNLDVRKTHVHMVI